MSRANVELVRRLYLTPGPMSDAPHVAPDAEFDFTSVYPDQPVLQGTQAMRSFRDRGPWGQSIEFVPERYVDVDDERVLVFVRVTSTGQSSGAPVETRIAQEITIREGLVVRIKVHRDGDEALQSLGLAE